MNSPTDLVAAAQDNLVGMMKTANTVVIESVKTLADAVAQVTPEIPMPSIVSLDSLVSPAAGMALTFGFAEKVLAAQKDFVESLAAAMAPATKATRAKSSTKATAA